MALSKGQWANSMIDDLKAIAIFAETVRQGSFRGAAKVLGLSPSVVSYHVSQLEQRLGNALLYRSTRKLSLTHKGEVLYQHAQLMLNAAQSGLEQIMPENAEPSGKLSISLPSVLSQSYISKEIAAFALRYPKVELNIMSTDTRQHLIKEGIDLAIRIGEMGDSSLKAKRLGAIKRKLVCSRALWQQQCQNQDQTDGTSPHRLETLPWIKLAMLPNSRTLIRPDGEKIRLHFHSQTTVNDVTLMTQLCKHGLGIATPPDYLIEHALADGSVIELLPDWQVESIPFYGVWPANASMNSNARHLLSYLSDN
ncbi:LysR family transcriptional regulator [Oceanospirillum beijerinckii]|uniref:LysR family transcriptional regulator n=1 Tax=Oceanospirillum beijerinckii TaxID=64976 RepID=UPI00041011E6|nr:LysR family transcriptional regulator [Oceanospirillum beijerinckii]